MAMQRATGMTLVELLTTMLVLAIVLGLGVPAFFNVVDNNRMAAAVNELVASVHFARSEAVKRRVSTTLCASADGVACGDGASLRDGWIVFVDGEPPAAPNGTVDGADQVLQSRGPLAASITTLKVDPGVTRQYLSFGPGGFVQSLPGLQPIANVLLCDRRGDRDTGGGVAAGRHVLVSPTGRPQVHRQRAEVQASPLGGCGEEG